VKYCILYVEAKERIKSLSNDYYRLDGSIIESRYEKFINKENYLEELNKELKKKILFYLVKSPVRIFALAPVIVTLVLLLIIFDTGCILFGFIWSILKKADYFINNLWIE
jgi:hypothetical protein